jgi:hypothetical protein
MSSPYLLGKAFCDPVANGLFAPRDGMATGINLHAAGEKPFGFEVTDLPLAQADTARYFSAANKTIIHYTTFPSWSGSPFRTKKEATGNFR